MSNFPRTAVLYGDLIASRASAKYCVSLAMKEGSTTRTGIRASEAILPGNAPHYADLSAASGAAFFATVDALDGKKILGARLSVLPDPRPALAAMVRLVGWRSRAWTDLHAKALYEALNSRELAEAEINDRLVPNPQGILQRLAVTGLPHLRAALVVFEARAARETMHTDHKA